MKKLILILTLIFSIVGFAFADYINDLVVTNKPWIDSRTYADLSSVVAIIGATEKTILIQQNETVTDLDIPSNISLKFAPGGMITYSGHLNIHGTDISAPPGQQIFDATGTGEADFGQGTNLRSTWFEDLHEMFDQTLDNYVILIIDSGWGAAVGADCQVGNGVTLKWEGPGNRIVINTGFELSNIKSIEAGKYQIFAGSGDFDFLDGTELKLDWFNNLRALNNQVESEEVKVIVSGTNTVDYNETLTDNIVVDLTNGNFNVTAGNTLTIYSLENIVNELWDPYTVDTLADLQDYPNSAVAGFNTGAGDIEVTTDVTDHVYVMGRTSNNDGYEGDFNKDTSDLSAEVATDTLYGIYVAVSSDPTGASGAWVRQEWEAGIRVECFGPNTNPGTTDMSTPIQNAIDLLISLDGGTLILGPYTYAIGTSIEVNSQAVPIYIQGSTAPNNPAVIGSTLSWIGGADVALDMTGSRDWKISDLLIDGQNTATIGLLIQRDGSIGEFNTGAEVRNCYIGYCVTGIQFSSNTGSQYQAFKMAFYDIEIKSCTTGIKVTNLNDIPLHFYNLSFTTYATDTLQMVNGVELTDGGKVDIHGLWSSSNLTGYIIYSDGNGEFGIFGGYAESNRLAQVENPASPIIVGPSSISGFKHYPSSGANYGINYDREDVQLSVTGCMIGNGINEGSNSGGICFSGSRLQSGTWSGKTYKSSEIGSTQENSRAINRIGIGLFMWSTSDDEYVIGNNVYWDGTYYRTVAAGNASLIFVSGGIIKHYSKISVVAGGAYDIGGFTEIFSLNSEAVSPGNTMATLRYNSPSTGQATGTISLGAVDSGGSGYRLLRVPN